MQENGSIRIQALTSRAELPVEDATVTVTGRAPDGSRELISVQLTDESGLTDPVLVRTPARSNSQSPDQPQGWTEVRVQISHPGYDGIIVERVQIFPGVTTVQELNLTPRGALPGEGERTERYDVPPSGL